MKVNHPAVSLSLVDESPWLLRFLKIWYAIRGRWPWGVAPMLNAEARAYGEETLDGSARVIVYHGMTIAETLAAGREHLYRLAAEGHAPLRRYLSNRTVVAYCRARDKVDRMRLLRIQRQDASNPPVETVRIGNQILGPNGSWKSEQPTAFDRPPYTRKPCEDA